MPSATAQLLLPDGLEGLAGLSSTAAELVDILSRCAEALQLRDTSSAALSAAALQAATEAQAAEDAEAAAFEASSQLAGQIAAAQRALEELRQLADELEAEGQRRDAAAAAHRQKVADNGGRAARYGAQQAALEAGLKQLGYTPELSQVALQMRGREHAGVAAELARVQADLAQYGGLPADEADARALLAKKRADLQALREKLRQNLDDLS